MYFFSKLYINATIILACPAPQNYEATGQKCICDTHVGLVCADVTIPDCYCPLGMYKDPMGVCVPKDTCIPQCTGDMTYQETGEECICETNGVLICTPINKPACYCPSTSYLNPDGMCVPKADCTGTCKTHLTTPFKLNTVHAN